MLIGRDYEKISFDLFGLELVEPNAIIGDSILFGVSMYLAYKVRSLERKESFFKFWSLFFVVFGIGFLLGGIGHTFFNYLDVSGKYPSWYAGIISVLFIEFAMISIYPAKNRVVLFQSISVVKFLFAMTAATFVFLYFELSSDPSVGLKIPSANTLIGLVLVLGLLGNFYRKKYTTGFKYHVLSVIVLLPAGIFQTLKISIAPWFDRNDLSHVFLLISLLFYYKGIKAYNNYLALDSKTAVFTN